MDHVERMQKKIVDLELELSIAKEQIRVLSIENVRLMNKPQKLHPLGYPQQELVNE